MNMHLGLRYERRNNKVHVKPANGSLYDYFENIFLWVKTYLYALVHLESLLWKADHHSMQEYLIFAHFENPSNKSLQPFQIKCPKPNKSQNNRIVLCFHNLQFSNMSPKILQEEKGKKGEVSINKE